MVHLVLKLYLVYLRCATPSFLELRAHNCYTIDLLHPLNQAKECTVYNRFEVVSGPLESRMDLLN